MAVTIYASDVPESEYISSESQTPTESKTDKYKVSVDVDLYTVDVNLVTTDVRVIGQPVSELQAEDFIIYDNGVPQKVAFISYDQLPVSFALLFQGSHMEYRYPNLKAAIFLALKNLKPEDEVALFSYGGRPDKFNVHAEFTRDRLLIAEKIDEIDGNYWDYNAYDAFTHTARYLREKARNRRNAIILLSQSYSSDGGKIENARSEILRSGASIFNIQLPITRGIKDRGAIISNNLSPFGGFEKLIDVFDIPAPVPEEENQPDYIPEPLLINQEKLKETVEMSGGDVFLLDSSTSFQEALFKAITYFRYQYFLGFYTSEPGDSESYHTLEVKLKDEARCPGCRVITRKGYYPDTRPLIDPTNRAPLISSPISEKTEELLVQRSIFTAGSTTYDFLDIPFTFLTSELESTDGTQIKVDLEIDPESIEFKQIDGRKVFDLQAAVFYWDKKGNVLGNDWRKIKGSVNAIKEDGNKQVLDGGIHFSTIIPVKDKHQMVKAVVYDEGSCRIGSKLSIPFSIEKIKSKEVDGQPYLVVKLKVSPYGISFEQKDDYRRTYNLKIAATDSRREDDISGAYWKEIEGTFEGYRPEMASEWPGIEAVIPDFTEGEVVRITVHEESSGKTSSRLIRHPERK